MIKKLPDTGVSWPEDGLENLGNCPVCSSEVRTLLHDNLKDLIFFCAPGTWTMWRCENCRSGYLDPRPTIDTIGRAYTAYYTHQNSTVQKETKSNYIKRFITDIRKRGRPAYLNLNYGHLIKPDLGPLNKITKILPNRITLNWEYYIRHLPAPEQEAKLLDIGCGNGRFLNIATNLGYKVMGLEIDLAAIKAARTSGFKVIEGGLPATGLDSEQFDQITLNHVLEHLHDPVSGVKEAWRLLKHGGRFWLQLPNIESFGHEIYGKAWRGLEPPRHLVLPSFTALEKILKTAGFTRVKLLKPADAVPGYFNESDKIRDQIREEDENSLPSVTDTIRKETIKYERNHPKQHEQLTLVAYKV